MLQQHILLSSWYISVFQKTVFLKEDSPRTSAAWAISVFKIPFLVFQLRIQICRAKSQRSYAGFCFPLDKGFFPIPEATANPPPAPAADSVAWEEQLPAAQMLPRVWFPRPSAKRDQRSRLLIPSQLPEWISSLPSTIRTAPEFPALPLSLTSLLDANVKKAGIIVPNLLALRYAVNTTGTYPICGSFSER